MILTHRMQPHWTLSMPWHPTGTGSILCVDHKYLEIMSAFYLPVRHYTLKHLQCYSWLHSFGMQAALRVPGRRCWLLMPKHHHLWHIAHEVLKTRVNPKKVMLLSAESFVGVIGRIARATHRSTVSRRTLERYLVQVHLKLKTKLG